VVKACSRHSASNRRRAGRQAEPERDVPGRVAVEFEGVGVVPPPWIVIGRPEEHEDLVSLGMTAPPSSMSRVVVRKKAWTRRLRENGNWYMRPRTRRVVA
jgi:hypothetical protein